MFERKELQDLRRKARQMGDDAVNRGWKRAYEDLAQAANVLDAFVARSTENEDPQ